MQGRLGPPHHQGHLRLPPRATLGHKVNHWPLPNSYIGWAVHPRWPHPPRHGGRFGRVRSIVALRALQAGEEVRALALRSPR